jgi:hypothetical protein
MHADLGLQQSDDVIVRANKVIFAKRAFSAFRNRKFGNCRRNQPQIWELPTRTKGGPRRSNKKDRISQRFRVNFFWLLADLFFVFGEQGG